MATQSPNNQELHHALDAFIQTTTMDEGIVVLKQHPQLLSDHADLLFSSIIDNARKQGHKVTAQALDERRDFIRGVRQELSENKDNTIH